MTGATGGFDLAFKADALWVGHGDRPRRQPGGRLAATTGAMSRLRTGLEGSRDYTLGGRLSLRPMVEVELRHDGGDPDTGPCMGLGSGVVGGRCDDRHTGKRTRTKRNATQMWDETAHLAGAQEQGVTAQQLNSRTPQ